MKIFSQRLVFTLSRIELFIFYSTTTIRRPVNNVLMKRTVRNKISKTVIIHVIICGDALIIIIDILFFRFK